MAAQVQGGPDPGSSSGIILLLSRGQGPGGTAGLGDLPWRPRRVQKGQGQSTLHPSSQSEPGQALPCRAGRWLATLQSPGCRGCCQVTGCKENSYMQDTEFTVLFMIIYDSSLKESNSKKVQEICPHTKALELRIC